MVTKVIEDNGRLAQKMRIVVLGYIIRGPLGGLAWHHLQYVLGLSELGHDVYFIEDSDDFPSCYDPSRHITDVDPTYGLRFICETFDRLGLPDRWGYHDAHRNRWHGPLDGHAEKICRSADVFLNVSGINPVRAWLEQVPHRVLIDTDPVFTQIRHLTDPAAQQLAAQHTSFWSFAENVGKADCNVPDDGLPWQATRQPVVLSAWSVAPGPRDGPYTTVMQWDSYKHRDYKGRRYGMKSESFAPFFDLPGRCSARLELALGNQNAPRQELIDAGWQLRDPLEVTLDPWSYQRYLKGSKAEFSVAKQGYVVSQCGWFSERSACYLASGRPVVVQDTGFSEWLTSPGGVIAFKTPEEALTGIEEVNSRYTQHCKAARAVAEEYFDARRVLTELLECVA
jgi:hypothetical protein